jgi:DNA-binding transcriptional LysR family regulator
LREAEPEDSLPMLKCGELDLALTFEYPLLPNSLYDVANEDIERIHLLDDPMYVALPPDHPLATKKRLRLADLSDQAWVQGDCSGLCGAMQLKACENSGFIPRVAYETDDYNVVQGLVAAGVAVSMIAELALTNVRDDIVIRSLGTDAPARKVYAATLKCQYRSPAAAAMLDILRDAADEYLASRRPAAAAASAAA